MRERAMMVVDHKKKTDEGRVNNEGKRNGVT